MQHLDGLKDKWLAAIAGAGALDQLESLRVEALGKKGEVTGLMKTLGSLSPEERKAAGQSLNQLKDALT
ncbi:MAG TPA: phenylalanine--tRNA ligase subunit alpha, partial [Dongiaceae bacterium]|nr:phenylalanine--tRNA ligase subunit alpha [Dongiaceae bacterium]